jgi:hypothetical protein
MEDYFVDKIKEAFDKTEADISKLPETVFKIEGMSGRKTRMFYNNLLDMDKKINYLEMGIFLGSTFISSLYNNLNVNGYAFDSFGSYSLGLEPFLNNVNNHLINNETFTIIQQSCFTTPINSNLTDKKFQVFLYDAGHTEEDHTKALLFYLDLMDDTFIYIVDDWNYDNVRNGTLESLKKADVTVVYSKEIRLTNDGTTTPEPLLSSGYWNGLYIAVLKKNN